MFLLFLWHNLLKMPKQDRAWHVQDMADEMAELKEARTFIERWSETSDVVYTYTRARWSGHTVELPIGYGAFLWGLLYMFPKYTLRWMFYRIVGRRTDPGAKLTEVRNPRKIEKLRTIAQRYQLDPVRFEEEAKKLLRWWPLLK
jgi:hypothetical protein